MTGRKRRREGRGGARRAFLGAFCFGAVLAALPQDGAAAGGPVCERTITADVVALDQVITFNRFGAKNPYGMIYALKRDVVSTDGGPTLEPGKVRLHSGKRPRPMVLRVNEGDCLQVTFTNLLSPQRRDSEQPVTRQASFFAMGLNLVDSISSAASFVGNNPSSLTAPGETRTYTYHAAKEGTHLVYSTAAAAGSEGNLGTTTMGLFGAINVEPKGAEWYRSQVTAADIELASGGEKLPTGHPKVDYTARYPDGRPILAMLDGNEIVHADINAIITGPNRGHFQQDFPYNYILEPNVNAPPSDAEDVVTRPREEPFREFTAIFHDEIFALQAFPEFTDPNLEFTLESVRDAFGVNYGIGGAGAPVLANRKGIGPAGDCAECKYEEFFLTSWANGDPAMITDLPVNAQQPGEAATKALYPDDPSNVHHSYLGDKVRFRQLNAVQEHHIFHLHAHQWLLTPNSGDSAYLDSQAVGPGSAYTYEIAFGGSGNRNYTAGDSIYHCHFYPHFAQGMWALWRVHDVFEAGTTLTADGKPAEGARALPDGEIAAGTPIPAVVPIPTLAMAPLPAEVSIEDGALTIAEADLDEGKNPGYPFWVPGEAGHRPPKPPMSTIVDGGLPRHVAVAGEAIAPPPNPYDFNKLVEKLGVRFLDENGTRVEKVAMAFHANRTHPSVTPEGQSRGFISNGQPAVPGAPFADPCVNDFGNPVTNRFRTIKGAAFQTDVTFNKVGWHFPQQRILAHNEDVEPLLDGKMAPQPFFFRAHSNDCVSFELTNLLPHVYEQDDYQVKTPTDVVGQHIHLVKFDVTASDGASNGWNYESGVLAPGEVRERIAAIREYYHCDAETDEDLVNEEICALEPEEHPVFRGGRGDEWLGAQTMVSRWYVDPITNRSGGSRTLRTVFSHDHFGPSTHQQAGYYAGLVIEPEGSSWRHPETGEELGTRDDGGPTNWAADILTADAESSYREFLLAVADFQPAYEKNKGGTAETPVPDPSGAINPPGRTPIGLPFLLSKPRICPNGSPPPCPEGVSTYDPGTMLINYRNEPLAHRLLNPAKQADGSFRPATGNAGDPAFAYRSDVVRMIPELNVQPDFYPPLTADVRPGDPFTPLIRSYKGDKVQVRMLVGAHEEGHVVSVQGTKWLAEAGDGDSGWRAAQMMGISEHFEFETPVFAPEATVGDATDHIYMGDVSTDGLWNGTWGLMRAYERVRGDLKPLPSNPLTIKGTSIPGEVRNAGEFRGACPANAPIRRFAVTAVQAMNALPGGKLIYNSRPGALPDLQGPLNDPTAILYVNDSDLTFQGKLKAGVPVEPLVLRANAGDCIELKLTNKLPATGDLLDLAGFDAFPMLVEKFNANQVKVSRHVGIQAQLLAHDVAVHGGLNVGMNRTEARRTVDPNQTVAPGASRTYRWYAGDVDLKPDGRLVATPVEFGAVNLTPADHLKQPSKGLVGALVIEPQGSTWTVDPDSRAKATVHKADGTSFRELVMVWQDNVNLRDVRGRPICPVSGAGIVGQDGPEFPDPETAETPFAATDCVGVEDSEDSGNKAVNYRTEPFWFRKGYAPGLFPNQKADIDFANVLSNSITGGQDPQTPILTVAKGEQVRIRLVQPGGHGRNGVFTVHGHAHESRPYANGNVFSQTIASNPASDLRPAREGTGAGQHFDFVLGPAGGVFNVPGDYLIRNEFPNGFEAGMWNLLRVTE